MIIETAKNSHLLPNWNDKIPDAFSLNLAGVKQLQDKSQDPAKKLPSQTTEGPKPSPDGKIWDKRIWKNPDSPPLKRYGLIIDTTYSFPVCNNKNHNCSERHGGEKIEGVVFHYTVLNNMEEVEAAFNTAEITPGDRKGGSSHIVISNGISKKGGKYDPNEDGKIYQFVPAEKKAFHITRAASWEGIDSSSPRNLGNRTYAIELVNPGKNVVKGKDGKPDIWANCTNTLGYETQPPYTRKQIRSLIAFLKGFDTEHDTAPWMKIGHNEVQLNKCDPGSKFPWKELAKHGIGIWVEPAPLNTKGVSYYFGQKSDEIKNLSEEITNWQYKLRSAGYTSLAINGEYDETMRKVVQAFQAHRRPARVDGILDPSTQVTLDRYLVALRKARTDWVRRHKRVSANKVATQ